MLSFAGAGYQERRDTVCSGLEAAPCSDGGARIEMFSSDVRGKS